MEAEEAEKSWHLVFKMGQAPKIVNPAFPVMQLDIICF